MATPTPIQSVTVALRTGVSEATLPNNVKMRSGVSYALSLEDYSKLSRGARESVIAEPTYNTAPWIVPLWNAAGYVLNLDTINNYSTIALLNADTQAGGTVVVGGVTVPVGKFYLGQVVRGFNDNAFKLVLVAEGSTAIAAGDVVVWGGVGTTPAYTRTPKQGKATNTVTGDFSDITDQTGQVLEFAGVAIGTITAGNYGWIQISGTATAKVLATVDAGDSLKVSTTDESLTNAENEVQTTTLTGMVDGTDSVNLTWDSEESTTTIDGDMNAAARVVAAQAAIDEAAIAGSTYPTYVAGDIVVTAGGTADSQVFTFSGDSVNHTDVSAITVTSGAGGAAGTVAETNKGAGDTAVGTDVVGTAQTAADTGTALVEIRSGLVRNLRSRDRDIFRNARN